ncbi:hypothetical protein V1503_23465 [Bacillus sp. SCS-151]|uniref:hypothetical protein n=1 Tax=Nanhaiella sioensis TaxID=3115293 RepID=UPI00397D950F
MGNEERISINISDFQSSDLATIQNTNESYNGLPVIEIAAGAPNVGVSKTIDVIPSDDTYTFGLWMKMKGDSQAQFVYLLLDTAPLNTDDFSVPKSVRKFDLTSEWKYCAVSRFFDNTPNSVTATIYPAGVQSGTVTTVGLITKVASGLPVGPVVLASGAELIKV